MTVAEYIVKFLAARGVKRVYELSGGMIVHLLDAADRAGLALVDMRHEQAAGFAAEGEARMTGVPGVAFATSGPGATNLLTAIASCYFDSTPAVFITGQVPRNERRGNRWMRQLGFQETDIIEMAAPVTKQTVCVERASYVPNALLSAFFIARARRPGPVLLDIPMDVLREEIDAPVPPCVDLPVATPLGGVGRTVVETLHAAKRPLVLIGGGVRAGNATSNVRALIGALGIPAVHSLMGKDVLGSDLLLNVGLIGSYGNRWANWALAECDCLLVLGSRLDVRQIGSDVAGFVRNKAIIHVDIDVGEDRVPATLSIHADLDAFCYALRNAWHAAGGFTAKRFSTADWYEEVARRRLRWPPASEQPQFEHGLNPNTFMERLGRAFPHAAAFVVDVGQHQMWAAQSLELREGQRFLTSGGMGAMGFALPAAIGACLASNRREVVCIAGDGGFQVNIQELQTVVGQGLPIKMVVMNNYGHGMVRQFQQQYMERQFVATTPSVPRFTEIAKAYGIPAWRSEDSYFDLNAVDRDLGRLARVVGPALLEVATDPDAQALPKMAFGRGLDDMDPKRP